MIAGTTAVGRSATRFREDTALWVTLICLAIAIPAHLYGRSLKQDRFITYDRERGILRLEYGFFRLKYREIPFWESEGYLVTSPNHAGLMRPTLHLQPPLTTHEFSIQARRWWFSLAVLPYTSTHVQTPDHAHRPGCLLRVH
jgi:hypothetical protein